MARNIVTLRDSNRETTQQEAANTVLEQMFGYFDAMESRFPTGETLPQAA